MMLATVATVFAAENTVWEGNEPISWNTEVAPGTQLETPEGIFSNLAVGDIVRAYTTTTYESPQYVVTYKAGDEWTWTDLDISVSEGVLSFTVADETMATEISQRGLIFRGQAYTLTKITVETPESGDETTETVIWEGSTALDWGANPGISVSLEAGMFASAKGGDKLKIEGTGTNEYTQIQVCVNYPWKSSDSYTSLPVNFEITADDLENIKANGMTIAGQNATITKITIVSGKSDEPQPVAGETYTAWTGEKVFTSKWEAWEQISASQFAQAQVGMLLRAKFKNVGAGAQLKFGDASWEVLVGTEIVNISGKYQQFTITEEMLAKLQEGGLIISGISFTLTAIEVINPADLKPLSLSVPVTGGDWVFENEAPTFTIHAQNPYDETVAAMATIEIATDKMAPVTVLSKEVTLEAGATEDIELTWTADSYEAGFYHATCYVNDDQARAFFFGMNPTQIVSAPDKQEDFESFWQTAKNELATIEADDEPVLTKIDSKSTDKRTVYLVEFKSVSDGDGQPVTVRGYYAEPNDGKKHPVIMHFQGYDSNYRPGGQDATPWCFDGDGDDLSGNYAEFILSTRGQSVNNRPASDRADGITRDFTNEYGDWFAYNFGDKDKYYYRGAYMDVVRAIDFMATRPTSDMTNLYAEGQSQGGAFTYAAAALSGREFKAIAPGIAFMGDFPDYFELANWPAEVARANQGTMTDDEMFAFLSYFDTKNLATLISDKTAVIATIGVQDNVCPPHTNIAPYNNLAAGTVKEISFNPENAHQVADNWYQVYMNYFASKYVEPQPSEKTRTENAQKLFDVLTSLYGNKIISGTTAVVDWNTNQAEQVYQWTNKYPAINTYDFINIHASRDVNPEGWLDYSDISGVKKWASEGGVVSAMWHWQVKNNAGTGYTCTPGTGDAATSFDASKIYVDGSAENILAKQQLSQICGYLKKMQAAGIPVIWRPLHEAAGNTCEFDGGTAWFWWGAKGADVYKQLWQWMYNYMVNEQGLYNLIWVWTSQTKDSSWYPGDDYVDIIGRDIYSGEAAQHKSNFDFLSAGHTNMMVALSECGNTNDASQSDISAVWDAGAKWSWFSTWYDTANSNLHNTQSWWTNAFSQDYVVTRDQMKELLDLNIKPDPEPQPATNTFNENGVADLNKIEVQGDKVTYDPATHTVTTTEGWTGVQLTVADGEKVSGKELRITFDREIAVKCYVKYTDETDADIISKAEQILYFDLDNTKDLYQIQIQPTEAATFVINEIIVNKESTKPVLKPLEEGETRTLFENAEGVEMSWNEICEKGAEWGAILEEGEEILVTVSGKKAEAEWPKVILRDANSEQVLDAFVNEVTEFPHVVKFTLDASTVEQLKNGFRISGDAVTITKVELSKPQKPTPQPAETVFDENGVADLSKIEAQGDKVTYDPETHTVTTTEGWTGVQLTVTDGEEVGGKELRITFDRDIAVKCYVKYTDETDADIISKSEQVLYFDLDETKNVYQIQIQPTEAATFVINEIVVNKESTKPVLKPLEEGETRTLFEDTEGVVMAWNEICQKEEDWGAILESGEVFYITVKSRTEGSEWPKVILRNSNSEEVSAVELGDVDNYPYIVKIKLTDETVEQLRSGFRFSGDGITVTKIEISKPAAAREGDVSIEAMNWFRNGVYDAETRTATTTARWGQTGWNVGDTRYDGMTLVIVNIEAADFPVTLKMEYDNTDGIALATSTGIAEGKTQINLPLPLDTKVIKKIYLTWAEPGEVTLTDASLIAAANARPLTGFSDETDGILSIENSELRMENSYNLAGQRVGDAYKGMIIKNGKKFMVK